MSLPQRAPATAADEGLRTRIGRWWESHRKAFWIAHSIWALATGVGVLVVSHERYEFVPWVVGFLGLTWASTMFFSRDAREGSERSLPRAFTSYATRVLYQETLFFLLPFYAYSTVFVSWNVSFLILLACLAVLACLDLVFDRWLREHPTFGLIFFAVVAFAALNLLLPMILGLGPSVATGAAAVLAVGTAVPLAIRGRTVSSGARLRLGLAGAAILVVAFLGRAIVPPVPLRLERVTFGTAFDRENLSVSAPIPAAGLSADHQIVALAEVFAPSSVPARVALRWTRDGRTLRTSREVEITAHRGGFRIWDVYRPEEGPLDPGRYRIEMTTADGRIFGTAAVLLR